VVVIPMMVVVTVVMTMVMATPATGDEQTE
jgi:hypothetical protein